MQISLLDKQAVMPEAHSLLAHRVVEVAKASSRRAGDVAKKQAPVERGYAD